MITCEDSFTELIPGLPEDISLLCLTRLHHSSHNTSSQVCKRWRHLIRSKDFYYQRRLNGLTRKCACFIQSLPSQDGSGLKPSAQQPKYGLTLFDPTSRQWTRIDPVPKYQDGLPLFCQVASTEGKLVVLGGWDPLTCRPVRDVFSYNFTTGRWRKCADMPETTSFFAVGALEGKVYVAGGHDESKNALKSAWVFDMDKNEWTDLGRMSEERDECEGLVIGSEFWIVSGYGTDTQGVFKTSADAYDVVSGTWRRVEDVCRAGDKSPRGRVGWVDSEKAGSLVSWDELDPMVRVGTCGVEIGEIMVVVTGSDYQGGPHGFYLVDKMESNGKKKFGKLTKMDHVPEEFNGIVQSGCCVEI